MNESFLIQIFGARIVGRCLEFRCSDGTSRECVNVLGIKAQYFVALETPNKGQSNAESNWNLYDYWTGSAFKIKDAPILNKHKSIIYNRSFEVDDDDVD